MIVVVVIIMVDPIRLERLKLWCGVRFSALTQWYFFSSKSKSALTYTMETEPILAFTPKRNNCMKNKRNIDAKIHSNANTKSISRKPNERIEIMNRIQFFLRHILFTISVAPFVLFFYASKVCFFPLFRCCVSIVLV